MVYSNTGERAKVVQHVQQGGSKERGHGRWVGMAVEDKC